MSNLCKRGNPKQLYLYFYPKGNHLRNTSGSVRRLYLKNLERDYLESRDNINASSLVECNSGCIPRAVAVALEKKNRQEKTTTIGA